MPFKENEYFKTNYRISHFFLIPFTSNDNLLKYISYYEDNEIKGKGTQGTKRYSKVTSLLFFG